MMESTYLFVAAAYLAVFMMPCQMACADGPLPEFTFKGVAVDPHTLTWAPGDDIEHPAFIKMEGLVERPLGKYYLYYGPHKHEGVGVMYAESLAGPWKEYEGNPVVKGAAAPDVRWVKEKARFQLWAHAKNSQTEMWTSPDGLNFEHHSVSIQGSKVGTKNATYTRFYEYPIEKHGNRYVMLYVGYHLTTKLRSVWLAHSTDAENWTQLKTPIVMPGEGETDALYDPCLFRWKGKNYVVYADNNVWRGGTLKYVEVDQELNSVQKGGTRYTLLEGPEKVQGRLRSPEFLVEDGKIHMLAGAGKTPRLCAYATANLDGTKDPESPSPARPTAEDDEKPDLDEPPVGKAPTKTKKVKGNRKKKEGEKRGPNALDVKLDDLLKGLTLQTVYETTFDKPLRMIHEDKLIKDGKIAREPSKETDWVLEGHASVIVKDGRLHITNDTDHSVLWNTREFPESFIAEWDFQHHAPQGTAIIFFAAQAIEGGSIFARGLPKRGGRFGNYTRGMINCYHTSYSATDEEGTR